VTGERDGKKIPLSSPFEKGGKRGISRDRPNRLNRPDRPNDRTDRIDQIGGIHVFSGIQTQAVEEK
jgi:hypothetical protein